MLAWTLVMEVIKSTQFLNLLKVKTTELSSKFSKRCEKQRSEAYFQDFGPEHLEGWSCHLLRGKEIVLSKEI
jgi:hypothetical protein